MAEVSRKSRAQKPAGTRGRTPQRIASMAAAKDQLVRYVSSGQTIQAGLDKIGRSRKTYELWRRNDPEFVRKLDAARQAAGAASSRAKDTPREWMPFTEWRKKFLGVDTFWHQLQWIDILEGREPRDLHPAQTFVKGKPNRILINTPPFHAKSTTLTVDYVAYRLCMDPSFRVIIISAGSELAKDFLFSIKQLFTDPDYLELQKTYGPDGGFEQSAESWTESRIVFSQAHRNSSNRGFHEKDANVLALGMRSKVYGRRADLALVDDSVDTTNVTEYAKQMKWLRTMVGSRLEAGGKLVVIGTRVSAIDLYSELMKGENYANAVSPWTHFASPAILEENPDDPTKHVTLWPHNTTPWVRPEDADADECLCEDTHNCSTGFDLDGTRVFARWDGIHLEKGPRQDLSAGEWALIYQQESIPEDATFPEMNVAKSTNSLRLCGRLEAGRSGYPARGMHGMYVIAGLDPSIKGFAGMIVEAVDRETQKRYVMNAWNLRAPTKDELVAKMKQVTEHYAVNEWRVENTGLLQFFTQDSPLRSWMATRGVRFTEHHTGGNKWDPSFGISSMASLFGSYEKLADGVVRTDDYGYKTITEPLIEFPRPNKDGIKALVHQLVTWTPDNDPKKIPQDMLMAMWFAEVGAREYLGYGRGAGAVTAFTRSNRFITGSRRSTVVNIAAYR